MLTHWMVATEVFSCSGEVCSATLTMVVSKTTARPPTISTIATFITCGSTAIVGSFAVLTLASPHKIRLRIL